MNSIVKLLLFISVLLFLNNTESKINYNRYIRNIYHIPSYHSIEECFKNDFYESINKNINDDIILDRKIYKTKLDKIVIYF